MSRAGVVLLNFGEPAEATPEAVVPFLERIFAMNAALEPGADPEQARRRSRQLAERRAPGLIAEYDAIGGSPLRRQAQQQADALAAELERRGEDARAYVAMQFTDPLIEDVLRRARADGVDTLVGLPAYPLCGPSTTVAALAQLEAAARAEGWTTPVREVSGWHRHPRYAGIWGDAIRATAGAADVSFADGARLVFSAHGTPLKYLAEGSRYDRYVEESCDVVARAAGADTYALGYQNHGNRPIEWTQPAIDSVIASLGREAAVESVVVVPISFLHEQSETLSELDIELRAEAEAVGLAFHRVPVPHDDPRLAGILADLVQAALRDTGSLRLRPCHCRPGARCTNGD